MNKEASALGKKDAMRAGNEEDPSPVPRSARFTRSFFYFPSC